VHQCGKSSFEAAIMRQARGRWDAMRHIDQWQPTKFDLHAGRWRATRDRAQVGANSRLYVELLARALAKAVPVHASGKLVDLGCGAVPLYGMYKDLVSEVVCVDWGQSPHKISHIDFECDLNKPLPFEAEDFDTIILSDVLEHLCEPAALWREMARVLRPQGRVLCTVPFFYWLHEFPHDYFRYTEFALRRFAGEASLQVLVLIPLGGSIEVMTDLLAKHLVLLPGLGQPLALALQSMVLRWSQSRPGNRAIGKTARYIPLGYLMVAQR